MNEKITIVSTKILRQSIRKQVKKANMKLIEHDFVETVNVTYRHFKRTLQSHPPHYVFTSRKAVDVFKSYLDRYEVQLPAHPIIYCLEGETLKAITHLGLKPLLTATSARQLAQMIVRKRKTQSLIFFCSEIRRPELPAILKENNISVKEIILYKTVLQPELISDSHQAVLFFSPSGAESYFSKNNPQQSVVYGCLGRTTAGSVRDKVPDAAILTASNPTQQTLIETVLHYLSSIYPSSQKISKQNVQSVHYSK